MKSIFETSEILVFPDLQCHPERSRGANLRRLRWFDFAHHDETSIFQKSLFTIVILVCCLVMTASFSFAQRSKDDETIVKTSSFKVAKGGSLTISVEAGNVRIIPWSKNEVGIRAEGDDEEDFEDLRMDLRGNTVHINNESSCNSCDVVYEVQVPEEFDLDIHTSDGNIEIQ